MKLPVFMHRILCSELAQDDTKLRWLMVLCDCLQVSPYPTNTKIEALPFLCITVDKLPIKFPILH